MAANDRNKESIGKSGIIKILLEIVQLESSKHGRVRALLEQTRAMAATVSESTLAQVLTLFAGVMELGFS